MLNKCYTVKDLSEDFQKKVRKIEKNSNFRTFFPNFEKSSNFRNKFENSNSSWKFQNISKFRIFFRKILIKFFYSAQGRTFVQRISEKVRNLEKKFKI